MCSKKCANPDLPGSTSLREPVRTVVLAATLVEVFFWAIAIIGAKASRIAARQRDRFMKSPLGRVGRAFYLHEQTGESPFPPPGPFARHRVKRLLTLLGYRAQYLQISFFARRTRAFFFAKGVFEMAASNLPARAPERQPEPTSSPRPTWPQPVKKTTRFIIKISGAIPS